jgi:hypothetical protein
MRRIICLLIAAVAAVGAAASIAAPVKARDYVFTRYAP